MGIVYEARDRSRDAIVALKTLPEMQSGSLYRFKQEFRSLVNVTHSNLVTLYELFAEQDSWFFTMEYIDGCNFLNAVWTKDSDSLGSTAAHPSADPTWTIECTEISDTVLDGLNGRPAIPNFKCDYARLRSALRQVAAGLSALHEAGKLHRDIKPSNVMVSAEGRAVILDFGLVAELHELSGDWPTPAIAGTVPYMSPEQSMGAPLTGASDWYALGVMLFEALTGRRPFDGSTAELIRAKQQSEAPRPSDFISDVPEDLERLCIDLLRRDRTARPEGSEVLARLDGAAYSARQPSLRPTTFVGRHSALAELKAAFFQAAEGRPSIVLLRGASGVGKSTLVRHFFETIANENVIELAGRCYEQEAVPYRAVDSAIDSLSQYLRRMSPEKSQVIMPRNAWALAQLFPVLPNVGRPDGAAAWDPFEQRRQAFQALRELFIKLCRLYRVVIHLDDLQWGDADSAALLAEVMRPPQGPPILLVASFRDERAEKNPFIRQLIAITNQPEVVRREITLTPLSVAESAILAERLLSGKGCGSDTVAAVASESGGNPLFVHSLAASVTQGSTLRPAVGGQARTTALDDLIWHRMELLPAHARRLVETVAVAGSPIAEICAYRAAGLPGRDPQIMSVLRNALLARSLGAQQSDEIDTYHDRIRESVVARLAPEERRGYHRELARALEEFGTGDAEKLAFHHEFSGDLTAAARHYLRAADRAIQVVAFDKAAALYRKALDYGSWSSEEAQELRLKLAGSLADAGRGLAAARLYEEASQAAPEAERAQLERRSAFHYCSSGYLDDGYLVSQRVLARYGMSLPRSNLKSILLLMTGHLLLRLRGLGFYEHTEAEVPREVLASIDAALEIAEGLGMVEIVSAMTVHLRGLRQALDAGEPRRIACTMALVSGQMSASRKAEVTGRYKHLIATSREIADRHGDPLLQGYCCLGDAIAELNQGRYLDQYESCRRAEEYFLQCRGVAWHLATIRTFRLYAIAYLGHFRELASACEELAKEGSDRGDLYLVTNVSTFPLPLSLIARDLPDEARRIAKDSLARWTSNPRALAHVMTCWTLTYTDLYSADSEGALRNSEQHWLYLRKSLLNRVNNLRVFAWDASGRAALASALYSRDRARLLGTVRRRIRKLESEYFSVPHAMAKAMRAGLADLEEQPERAIFYLREALSQFEDLHMTGFSNAIKLRLATLVGGDEGRELSRQSEAWAQAEGVHNLDCFKRLYTSGFREDRQ
ncbi:MAG: protein kinase [Acidobacteriaceae bacterium]|nr:protein kinase [Acidobacteriaceae bacterium]